jgi:hypothetical protein
MHAQNHEAALQSVWTLLGLARALGQEPSLIAHEQRGRALNAAFGVLEQILAQRSLAMPQLQALDEAMAEADRATAFAYSQTLLADRCLTIEALRPGNPSWRARLGPSEAWVAGVLQLAGRLSGYTDGYLLNYLRAVEPWIAAAASGATPAGFDVQARDSMATRFRSGKGRSQGLEDYLWHSWNQQRLVSTQLRIVRCAIAVERFRNAYPGRVPESFEELVPQFLSGRPDDPLAPGMFAYRRLARGYVVSSLVLDQDRPNQRRRGTMESDLRFTVAR